MPAVVILGLKVAFRDLWEKVDTKSYSNCNCSDVSDTFAFCPHCGLQRTKRIIKVYRSRLTGEETTYRSINSLWDYLQQNDLDIYDTHPRGYTDDPVYIYYTQPSCILKVDNSNPSSLEAVHTYDIGDWLRDLLGDGLWEKGQFGLWCFESETVENHDEPMDEKDDDNSTIEAFIIPFNPQG